MLRRASARLTALRASRPSLAEKPRGAFGFGDPAEPGAPGFKEFQAKPPETVSDTVKYLAEGTFKAPLRKEIIEAIGYPGQKKNAGVVTMLGRIHYGPGRYDYGRPKMPKGWFANWFYFAWEFGHLMFVVDRWIFFRQLRHLVMFGLCYLPFWLHEQSCKARYEDFKRLNQA